jgi:hypothetical protein
MSNPAEKKAAPILRDVPPVQRRRSTRDLQRAVWLRPRDIEEIYGIEGSTLSRLCTSKDEAKRLPSVKLSTRKGGGAKGVRLVKRADLDAYLERHMQT